MIESTSTAICDECGNELSPYYTEMDARQSILELGWEIEPDGRLRCVRCVEDEDEVRGDDRSKVLRSL